MNDDRRTRPALTGDEYQTLTTVLQRQRDTLMMKCAGLDTEQLRRRAVPTSRLTLLGLVRHLTEVEHGWFHDTLRGEGTRRRRPSGADGQPSAFHVQDADPAHDLARWEDACARSRAAVAAPARTPPPRPPRAPPDKPTQKQNPQKNGETR
ncbi:DUF664 domain-containing protein, partial [Streptomyces sp. NPDC058662]|uniref:mycothiol transferase n=1 Tax=Streptomyces sp. NPDC058662 TaxID=3346583 RepID=UPI0036469F0F